MTKVTFDRDYLVEELDIPSVCIDQEPIAQTRWETHWRGVAEIDGLFYQFEWSEGSTEMQDGEPWVYETEVEAVQVEKRSVTVEKWVPVGE